VILYVKSRFFFITRGVQLDNGVDPPSLFWTHSSISFDYVSFWYPFLEHLNIGVRLRIEADLGTSSLCEQERYYFQERRCTKDPHQIEPPSHNSANKFNPPIPSQ
jgi:hypothetical protein